MEREDFDTTAPPALPRWREVLVKGEATISVMFAFLFGLFGIGAAIFVAVASYKETGLRWQHFALVPICIAEGAFLISLKSSLEKGYHPFITTFALRQRVWPLALRPLVALWWLAHVVVAMAALWGLEHLEIEFNVPTLLLAWKLFAFAAGCFSAVHTAQLYLLLTVTAVNNNEWLVQLLWRYRFAVDALTIIATGLGLFTR